MGQLPQISEAEYEIMKILWEEYPLSTNEICERAQQTHSWNQKTIPTLLSRLNNKRGTSYEQRGRMYYYFPIISQNKYLEQENHHFLDRFYDGKAAPMLSALLSNETLTDSDLQEMYDMIQSKIKGDDGE